jgi:hypothetical protein
VTVLFGCVTKVRRYHASSWPLRSVREQPTFFVSGKNRKGDR